MGVSFTKIKQIYNLVIDIVYNMYMRNVCVRVRGVVRLIWSEYVSDMICV